MTNQPLLDVRGLHVALENGEEILRGTDLQINPGEVHVIMGPNGSGKSTLANTIMGSPEYHVTAGTIAFDGQDITTAPVNERAKKGLFMAFQSPEEIDGVSVSDFLRTAKLARDGKPVKMLEWKTQVDDTLKSLGLDDTYADRALNVGFSGGEKKKSEILQMLMLQPKLAILDETDSGLDVDAVRIVTDGILRFKTSENSLLIISHSTRLLERLPVDAVHILYKGRFVHSGARNLIDEVEANGFASFIEEAER
ncbi:MAG: Fe-S cluster assembly ATPase SufC [Sphaerochaetaceae bacterium]|jgi:Fe-S cluster assembly ATP-binding protein